MSACFIRGGGVDAEQDEGCQNDTDRSYADDDSLRHRKLDFSVRITLPSVIKANRDIRPRKADAERYSVVRASCPVLSLLPAQRCVAVGIGQTCDFYSEPRTPIHLFSYLSFLAQILLYISFYCLEIDANAFGICG